MNPCPECRGARVSHGIACPGGRPLILKCSFCRGTGEVTDERLRWRAEGERLRALRMSMDFTLREFSRRLDIGAADLSDAERGRVNPSPMFARVVAALGRPAPDGETR